MNKKMTTEEVTQWLHHMALSARELAIAESTKVGAALMTTNGRICTGCNVEAPWKTGTVHAEVAAIVQMVNMETAVNTIRHIVIVADREHFTPCGSCRDWINKFASVNTLVTVANLNEIIETYTVPQLLPFAPE